MNRIPAFAVCAVLLFSPSVLADDEAARSELLDWSQLSEFPAHLGVAGPFVGVHNEALIVAGGANFPDGVPWGETKSSLKRYYSDIYVLSCPKDAELKNATWRSVKTNLSDAIGYGASISTPDGIICIGGEWQKHERGEDGEVTTTKGLSNRVFVMRWNADQKAVKISDKLPAAGHKADQLYPLPALPVATTAMAAAVIGQHVYVAGGATDEGATDNFWRLDLSTRIQQPGVDTDMIPFQWEKLPSWPGPPRSHAIAAVQHSGEETCFYLFSGRNKQPGEPFETLADAYRFNPIAYRRQQKGIESSQPFEIWKRLNDIQVDGGEPRCLMAGTATNIGSQHIVAFSGDSGEIFLQLENEIAAQVNDAREVGDAAKLAELVKQGNDIRDNHPGFSRDILLYHTITDTWVKKGELPGKGQVTTSAVKWRDAIVIPSGEIRPGVRTREIWSAKRPPNPSGFGAANWSVLAIYMAAMVGMGIFFARREKSASDFFLGGGRVPWWAAGISIFATMLSAITYLAIPASAFGGDWHLFIVNMGIPLVAPLVILCYLPFFRRLRVTSAYEYLEARFSVGIRLFGSLSFVIFQLGRMGVIVLLPALALSAVTGLNVFACIIIMGVLSTIYTALGGIEAVIWTDVLQTVVLLGGAVAAVFIMAGDIEGGFSGMIETGYDKGKFNLAHLHWDWTGSALAVVIIGAIFNSLLPYTSDQAVIQRYMTTSDDKAARSAVWLNAFMVIPASLLFFGVGTALYVFYLSHPADLEPITNNDQIFAWFIVQEMPAGLAGLVIAGVFAAAMSSLDSSMHSIATALTTDFVRRFKNDKSEEYYFGWARGLTIFLGLLGTVSAMAIATMDIQSLWSYYLGIIGLLLGVLGGLFTLGIFTRHTSSIHAWLGVAGAAVALVYARYGLELHGLLNGGIAIGACVGIGAIGGILIPRPPKNIDGLTIRTMKAADQTTD
jgi:SSS family transporter